MACPMCKKPTVAAYKPFCSKRCANVDLGKWLTGAYVIAGDDSEALADLDAALNTSDDPSKPH